MKDEQRQRGKKRKLTNGEKGSSSDSSITPTLNNYKNDAAGNGRARRASMAQGNNQLKQEARQAAANVAKLTVKQEEGNAGNQMTIGDVVWARLSCRAPWWPATIIDPRLCGYELNDRVWVFWLGDSRISDVDKGMVKNLAENFSTCFRNGGSQNYMTSVRKAIEIFAKGAGFAVNEDPVEWASANFASGRPNSRVKRGDAVYYSDCVPTNCNDVLPDFIVSRLSEIRELQESKLSEDSSDESGEEGDDESDEVEVAPPKLVRLDEEDENSDTSTTDSNSFSSMAKTNPNDNKVKRAERRAVVNHKSLNELCLCCGCTTGLYTTHPMFEGRMCKTCCGWYKEVCFVYDQDGKKEHCSVCGCGGDLLICDNSNCANVFCKDCITTLDSEKSLKEILETDPWSCYVCIGRAAGLIRPRKDWETNLFKLFNTTNILDDINWSLIPKEKRPIRVLSLFDGVGTGKIVLEELGLDIGAYFCSEIDPDAMLVTRVNHPKEIEYLGDARYVDLETIKGLCPIDLLIGGSPCNDISIANPKRRGLYDPEGTGILFFEYYRILQTLLQINSKEGRNLFWLFENVASMREQYRSVINRFLGKPPALYDSCHFSAQNRARYFWGNIPGMYNSFTPSGTPRSPVLDDILVSDCGRVAKMQKVRTVTTRTNSLKQGRTFSVCPVEMDGKPDTLWPTELETLFGLPRHYTDVGSLSPTKRQKLIGQGWTVPVVKHILRPLQRFFKAKDNK